MSSDLPMALSNEELALKVIQACWDRGCREFVVCAGSRNSPLVLALMKLDEQTPDLKIWNFFEERSAAFFALGRSKITASPSAVVTTSGTAAAELLPAVIEAHYADIPMILLTADRPPHFEGSGAPQTIEQKGIMSPFSELIINVCAGDSGELEQMNGLKSLKQRWHINVCFDEPLCSESRDGELDLGEEIEKDEREQALPDGGLESLRAFVGNREGLVVLSGNLRPDQRTSTVFQWLKRLGCPIWAEAGSGLRENGLLEELIIRSADRYFSKNPPRRVLRIGDVPSLRFWRDLETLEEIKVFSIDPPNAYAGLARDSEVIAYHLSRVVDACPVTGDPGVPDLAEDREDWSRLERLLNKYPHSEPAIVKSLSDQIPSESMVFLGNSMPVREWNLTADYVDRDLRCYASRGANGIDGQCSTFLGLSANEPESWALFGDLTALYDLSAPWVLSQLKAGKRRFVIINNGGGRIFSRLPHLADLSAQQKRVTENHHQMNFHHWAAMWGLEYQLVKAGDTISVDDFADQDSVVIELCPEYEQTELFWRDYSKNDQNQE